MAPSESEESKKPEIFVDEDWKSRVKAEDAALDQKLREEQGKDAAQPQAEQQPSEEPSEEPKPAEEAPASEAAGEIPPLPAPDFSVLVGMLSTQAFVSLGIIPNPATGKPELQLNLAKHLIDLLAVVENKTKGNLDKDEQSLLDSTLHQLRMVFVEQSKRTAGGES